MSEDAASILKRDGELVSGYLRSLKDKWPDAPTRLLEAIDYSLLAGGKRVRPTLVIESFKACLAAKPATCAPSHELQTALAGAGAIELIHTFSLVHDDLPAMDDDDLRRGRPTSHKVFGEAMAILAGDAMVTMAFEIIARDAAPDLVAPLVRELAGASGPSGMIGGQVLDIASENQSLSLEQLQQIHRMKTGALLTASCRLGAIAARADEQSLDAVTRFGQHTGLAFQIVDDILDVTATEQEVGKATGKDSSRGKNTYPALLGLETSKEIADTQLKQAEESLRPLGDGAGALATLARFVVSRSN